MAISEKKIDVSVIVVTWNVEDIIEDCLNSLFKYTNLNCEVIIVDNSSIDDTCKIIKSKYANKVTLIESSENLGFSKANNVALEQANGEYIFYMNPDVIFIEDILGRMIELLERHPNIGIVSPRLLNADKSLQISYSNFPSVKKVLFDDFKLGIFLSNDLKMKYYQTKVQSNQERYVDWTHGAAHLCRREDIDKINGYPDSYFMYGEDTEFCMIFLEQLSKQVYYAADCRLIHLGGYSEKQVLNSKKIIYGTNASLYFVRKYYGNIQMMLMRWLLFINYSIKFFLMNIRCLFSSNDKNLYKREKFKVAGKTVLHYKNQVN